MVITMMTSWKISYAMYNHSLLLIILSIFMNDVILLFKWPKYSFLRNVNFYASFFSIWISKKKRLKNDKKWLLMMDKMDEKRMNFNNNQRNRRQKKYWKCFFFKKRKQNFHLSGLQYWWCEFVQIDLFFIFHLIDHPSMIICCCCLEKKGKIFLKKSFLKTFF